MNWHWLPNLITCARIALVLPLSYYLIIADYPKAFILFIVAGLSDALDGMLARRFNWLSRFGEIADPLADKLLLTLAYVLLAYNQIVPWWLSTLVILRDVMIVVGALVYHYIIGPYRLRPSYFGKFNTALQIAYVFFVLLELVISQTGQFSIYLQWATYLVAISALLSGLHYLWIWGVKFNRARSVA